MTCGKIGRKRLLDERVRLSAFFSFPTPPQIRPLALPFWGGQKYWFSPHSKDGFGPENARYI